MVTTSINAQTGHVLPPVSGRVVPSGCDGTAVGSASGAPILAAAIFAGRKLRLPHSCGAPSGCKRTRLDSTVKLADPVPTATTATSSMLDLKGSGNGIQT